MTWWIKRIALVLVVLTLVGVPMGGLALFVVFRSSLARQTGNVAISGLAGSVEVTRDARGVPRIVAASGSFDDIAAAQGFVHAQERFFQMDLLRRRAEGTLAELVGDAALSFDRAVCAFEWRRVSREAFERLPEHQRRWLERYAQGVNAGLADLGARPPEYVVLMSSPRAWEPADSVLCALAMHEDLSFGHDFEWRREAIRSVYGPEMVDFLMPATNRWDTPLDGPPGDPDGPAPIPGPDVLARGRAAMATPPTTTQPAAPTTPPKGSNNWAVDASRTADGRAIMANDMHLGLMVPATWFHVQLEWGQRRAAGVSLPGVPGIVAGTTRDLAWGFTNVSGDFEDWIVIEPDALDSTRYRVPEGGTEPLGTTTYTLAVRGGTPATRTVATTRWGPITRRDSQGRGMVLKWPPLDAQTLNLNVLDMVTASTLEEGIDVARGWWGPPQNVMIASRDGRIAMVISGFIPARVGFDGRYPQAWSLPNVGWNGPADERERPVFLKTVGGALWSANNRTMSPERAAVLGGEWGSGYRARRISELIASPAVMSETDLHAMHLDTRAGEYDLLREAVLAAVPADEPDAALRRAREALDTWNGRADIDHPGMGVAARLEQRLRSALLTATVTEPVRTRVRDFSYFWFGDIEPLHRLLEERPAHWLPSGVASWDELIRRELREVSLALTNEGENALRPWGAVNRARVRHPLAIAVPMVGRWLDMPDAPLPGHPSTVRAQGPSFGQSERLVVSPGHEEQGTLAIPGGPSGHFLSPHYASQFDDWAAGNAPPLLVGEAASGFTLTPAK